MRRWCICLAISLVISLLGIAYIVYFMAQDGCLDSGGRWLGALAGCDGGSNYSMEYLMSPLAITIFLAIVLGISSALVQLHSMLFESHKKHDKQRSLRLRNQLK